MAKTQYITIQGDRWDTVAFKAYGDAMLIKDVVSMNPQVPAYVVFPAGITLFIEIKEQTDELDTDLLPPWKRVPSESEQAAAVDGKFFIGLPSSGNVGSFDNSFDNSFD